MHHIETLSLADARKAIAVIEAELLRLGKAAAIAVADPAGELLAFARMDGCPLPCIANAINKAFTSARERKATLAVGQATRHPEKGFDIAYFGDRRYIGWAGGIPVFSKGAVIGAVAISGLPQEEDARIAQLGVDAILAG